MGQGRNANFLRNNDQAACKDQDPELFYAEALATVMRAKQICQVCPVREGCLDHGIRREEFGIWGGTTARERAAMRRRHGLQINAIA